MRNPCQEGFVEIDHSNHGDAQIGKLGTITNFDMLMLHENCTLPLSDACSKSVSSNFPKNARELALLNY